MIELSQPSFAYDQVQLAGKDVLTRCKVESGTLKVGIPKGDSVAVTISVKQPVDLSAYRYVMSQVTNSGPETVVLRMAVLDSTAKSGGHWGHYAPGLVVVRPGETKPLVACLSGNRPAYDYLKVHLPKMSRLPGMFEFTFWRNLNASSISKIRLMTTRISQTNDRSISLAPFQGALPISAPSEAALTDGSFFPFIDTYGQYNKLDWPDKIRTDEDLIAMRKKEESWHAARKRMPTVWNQYGGWADGPKLKATGHFRTEKVDGKWWFVDPDGRLFWSKGSTGIGFSVGGKTPLQTEQRRRFFSEIRDDMIVPGRRGVKQLVIGGRMEALKYGRPDAEEWKNDLTIQRAWSFGLNTAGAWSSVRATATRKLPYTVMLHPWSRTFREKLFDPYDPGFRKSLEKSVSGTVGKAADDPWCLGYFINNELHWEGAISLGTRALQHGPKQPAKLALLEQLKKKYDTIEALNTAWSNSYGSWQDLLAMREAGAMNVAKKADLTAFGNDFCDTFFRTIKEVMTQYAPKKLYLGDRFNKNAAEAIRACARYADVVSFNKYDLGVEGLKLPKDSKDTPILVGEFCFVRGGRRHVSAELGEAFDPDYRGRAYAQYIVGALKNPDVIGCHWFQWGTQPVSGRGDGENYEQGFLDACDTPYWGLAHYSRALATHMYAIRLNGESGFDYAPPMSSPKNGGAPSE